MQRKLERSRWLPSTERPAAARFSPLAGTRSDRVASSLRPSRSRKRSPPDFRTEIDDHVVGLDLSGSTIVKHYVAARPQCPSCGRKKMRDPLAPVPVELGAGGKLVMTSGGYVAEGHGCTFPQAREPLDRCGLASRADRSRFAPEHQLPCQAQFFGAGRDSTRTSSGRG